MMNWLRLGTAAAMCASALWAVDWNALRPQGYLSDFAGVIDRAGKDQLEDYCGKVERATGIEIVLVIIPSLEGEPVDDVARTVFRSWRVAGKGQDRRVMVLATVDDHHDWMETAAGLPGDFTAGLADVLSEARPALQQKEYGEAMKAAAETIGRAAARFAKVSPGVPLPRRIHRSLAGAIPWAMLAGALAIVLILMFAGNPSGYGGFGGRGLLPALVRRGGMCRTTWGCRGGGGFGGFDSGDLRGGFGGSGGSDW